MWLPAAEHHRLGLPMLGGESQGRLPEERTAHFNLGDHSKGKLKGRAEWGWGGCAIGAGRRVELGPYHASYIS